MNARHARQIREGIIIARQHLSHERMGPNVNRFPHLTAVAYQTFRRRHGYWADVRYFYRKGLTL